MTVQLQEEQKSLTIAKQYLNNTNIIELKSPIIREYGSGYLNKKEKHSADFLLANGKKISVKTKGGVFTKANLGTGIIAFKKWFPDASTLVIDSLKEASNTSMIRRNELIKNFGKERWSEIPDIEKNKFYVIEPFLTYYNNLFLNYEYLNKFIRYLCDRDSDYLLITGNTEKDVMIVAKHNNDLKRDFYCQHINSKSLGIFWGSDKMYELRFKTEGGKIKSSVKINVQ